MRFAVRLPSVFIAGLCVLAAGCGGSHNKGKIEGKWKFVEPGLRDGDGQLRESYLVFGDDGSVTLDGPRVQPGAAQNGPKPPTWRYKLLSGDAADFYDLPADATERFGLFPGGGPVRVTIVIEYTTGNKYEGRSMTLLGADGRTLHLVLNR